MRSAAGLLTVQVSSAHPSMPDHSDVAQVVFLAALLVVAAGWAYGAWRRFDLRVHCECADGRVVGTIGAEDQDTMLAVVEYVAANRRYRLPAVMRRSRRHGLAEHVTVVYDRTDPSIARLGDLRGTSRWVVPAVAGVAALGALLLLS
jgi:hypothetical protein